MSGQKQEQQRDGGTSSSSRRQDRDRGSGNGFWSSDNNNKSNSEKSCEHKISWTRQWRKKEKKEEEREYMQKRKKKRVAKIYDLIGNQAFNFLKGVQKKEKKQGICSFFLTLLKRKWKRNKKWYKKGGKGKIEFRI